jgi:kinesin family protein C2/C3
MKQGEIESSALQRENEKV